MFRQPFHLGAVGRGFLADDDVAAGKDRSEAVEHPVRAADHVVGLCAVGAVEPGREADATGHAVQLGDGETFFGRDDIRADDARDVVPEDAFAGERDQFGGLTGVQVGGDPGGLFASDAELVEQVAGALEKMQPVAEFLQFIDETVAQGKSAGRKQPFFFRK